MFIGRVVGNVWSTVKWPQIEGLKLLTVQPYDLHDLAQQGAAQSAPPCSDLVVCADMLDAGVGDDVVVAYGHAARVAMQQSLGAAEQTSVPVDAAVVAVVDQVAVDQGAVAQAAAALASAGEPADSGDDR